MYACAHGKISTKDSLKKTKLDEIFPGNPVGHHKIHFLILIDDVFPKPTRTQVFAGRGFLVFKIFARESVTDSLTIARVTRWHR